MAEFPIFISYSRKDIGLISPIRAIIEDTAGSRCWMDLNAIESGSPRFTKDITSGINNCEVFLFMLSENSQRSQFALRELSFANSKGKHVVIVNIDDCAMVDEFKFLYGLTDTISWNDMPQREKLLRDLKRWVCVAETTTDFDHESREGECNIQETKQPQFDRISERDKPKKKKKLWPWIVIGIVVVAALVYGIITFTSPKASVVTRYGGKLLSVGHTYYFLTSVEGGTFIMGDPSDEPGDNGPAHSVTVSSFFIGETEVTQDLWKAVMGSNPSWYIGDRIPFGCDGDNLPVECVSWEDCQEFISKLNKMTGKNFRLPTEAEWEFAARGGNRSKGYLYSGSDSLATVAWYWDNSGDKLLQDHGDLKAIDDNNFRTQEVRTKKPNELDIYDMSGNVSEWCDDTWYDYSNSSMNNPRNDGESGSDRIARGGDYFWSEAKCRVYYRYLYNSDERRSQLGFRLCLPN